MSAAKRAAKRWRREHGKPQRLEQSPPVLRCLCGAKITKFGTCGRGALCDVGQLLEEARRMLIQRGGR